MTDHKTTGPTESDHLALARCDECWDDGEGTDVGPAKLARLVEIGWVQIVGADEYEITRSGARELQWMGR